MKRNLFISFGRFNRTLFLSLLLLLCFSCKKEEPQVNQLSVTNDDISFRDGRLIFKDNASFMEHQQWLYKNQKNPQLITERNEAYGLKSMTEYYLEGMKLEESDPKFEEYVAKYPSVFCKETYDNSTLYLLPHSILLCYVANKDGIYQIGDQIHRIAGNYIYQINAVDESKIEMLFLPKDQLSTMDVKILLSQPKLAAKVDYGNKTEKFENNDNFRIVSSLREYTNGISWWDDIITNPQHKVGAWFRAQLNTKSAHGDGYKAFCQNCTQYPIYASYDENTGESQQNIAFGGSQINMSASDCPAFSRGRLVVISGNDTIPEWIYILWGDALESPPTSCTVTHLGYEDDPF